MFWSTRKSAELSYRFENVYVHPTAEVAEDVEIGPFSYIGPNCRVGEGCRLHNHVTLMANTILGPRNEVFPGAVLGGEPQDKKYVGEESWVIVGDGNTIRENVTIHGGTASGSASSGSGATGSAKRTRGVTRIGSRNLLMAGCHAAHDTVIEDEVVIANNVLLGGHVKVESFANLGGQTAVHHFVTVGQHAFVGGMSRVSQDVTPFMLGEGSPFRVRAVNKVGLSRRGFSEETIRILTRAYRMLYRDHTPRPEALEILEREHGSREVIRSLIEFLRQSGAGHHGRARQPYQVNF